MRRGYAQSISTVDNSQLPVGERIPPQEIAGRSLLSIWSTRCLVACHMAYDFIEFILGAWFIQQKLLHLL